MKARIMAVVIMVAVSIAIASPWGTDAGSPQKSDEQVNECVNVLKRIEKRNGDTLNAREVANAKEAQNKTGRWEPVYEATEDHVSQEKIDDEISEHFDLMCKVVFAEAGNQGDKGMRLVADVIINRMRCGEAFDDTLVGVLTAKNQFACVADGGADRWKGHTKKEVRKICQEELMHVSNDKVFYFRTGHYGYGRPLFKYKDHYFSGR